MSIRSGDIHESCQKSCRNLDVFCPPKIYGPGLPKVMWYQHVPRGTPVEKFREDAPTNLIIPAPSEKLWGSVVKGYLNACKVALSPVNCIYVHSLSVAVVNDKLQSRTSTPPLSAPGINLPPAHTNSTNLRFRV